MATRIRRRMGITLVEVLVTMAIIAVLVGMLLPAVSSARSAARKAQCNNNLKQLALAVQGYHQRHDSLPPYWGVDRNNSPKFGGWLLHVLPDLGMQNVYDVWPDSGMSYRYRWFIDPSEPWLPACPPSDDYVPGEWKTTKIGEARVNTHGTITIIPIYKTELIGRKGHPGAPARPVWKCEIDTSIGTVSNGFVNSVSGSSVGQLLEGVRFPSLACLEDPSDLTPGEPIAVNNRNYNVMVGGSPSSTPTRWATTNYVANAHTLVRFGSRFTIQNTASGGTVVTGSGNSMSGMSFAPYRGLFMPPQPWPTGGPYWSSTSMSWWNNAFWNNSVAAQYGMFARRNEHIVDGLSNTIMFAETMRQCDAGNTARIALLPCNYYTHEHAFGIEPSYPDAGDNTKVYPGSAQDKSFGHTLMFQVQPGVSDCNPMRTQAIHGAFLLVAMADGSVRAISSNVTRKEAIGANATGRDGFARFKDPNQAINAGEPQDATNPGFWTAESRMLGRDGGTEFERPDGIWDLLMLPQDPPWAATATQTPQPQVLSNTGEVGKDK